MGPPAAWPVVVALGVPDADVALVAGEVVVLEEEVVVLEEVVLLLLLQAAASNATADMPTVS
jgi:hypothetical protein